MTLYPLSTGAVSGKEEAAQNGLRAELHLAALAQGKQTPVTERILSLGATDRGKLEQALNMEGAGFNAFGVVPPEKEGSVLQAIEEVLGAQSDAEIMRTRKKLANLL